MKNKLFMTMMIILVVIALVGAIAIFVLMNNNESKDGERTIDEILESTVDVPEITTNLAGSDFIRISFKIQTDREEAKAELEKRDFQVHNLIILELSDKTAESIQGKEGQLQLEETLKVKINELMQEGEVEKVYITQFLLQ